MVGVVRVFRGGGCSDSRRDNEGRSHSSLCRHGTHVSCCCRTLHSDCERCVRAWSRAVGLLYVNTDDAFVADAASMGVGWAGKDGDDEDEEEKDHR